MLRTRIGRICWFLCYLYLGGLLLTIMLTSLFGDWLWPLVMLRNFTFWLMLPIFPMAPILIWYKRWTGTGLTVLNFLLFFLLFARLFLPKHVAEYPAGSQPLRV